MTSASFAIAGHAAFASWNMQRSDAEFTRARETATTEDDAGDAIWGLALAAMYGRTGHLAEALQALKDRSDQSPIDLVRYALARLARARVGGGLATMTDLEDALHVARNLGDPRARTNFTTSYGYYRGLRAQYTTALDIARETLQDALSFDLPFVVPHANWNIAFSHLGLRQFSAAEKALSRVEASHVIRRICITR